MKSLCQETCIASIFMLDKIILFLINYDCLEEKEYNLNKKI